jgi:hypothetical protein
MIKKPPALIGLFNHRERPAMSAKREQPGGFIESDR